MLGFARNMVFFRVNGGFVAEKVGSRATVLGVRFSVESFSICARNVTEGSR